MDVLPVDDNLAVYDGACQPTTALKNLWRGCAGFYVCGGPSIKTMPYQKLAERGICSLAINNVAGMVPVKAFTFNDPPEKFHIGIWRDPGIMKFLPRPKLTHKGRGQTREKLPTGGFRYVDRRTPDYPNVWGYDRADSFTPDTFLTATGASLGNNKKGVSITGRPKIICSMFLGLRLLHYLGVRRVYLLGVDFGMDPSRGIGGNYAFGEIRHPNDCDTNNDLYRTAAPMLTELRPVLERAGMFVFNCNQQSRLKAFDYVPFEDALEDCRNGVPDGPLDLEGWYRKGERPS